MKEGEFESKLRKQLEGFEMKPPADLWQKIEEKVATGDTASGNSAAKRTKVVWMRRLAAAAVLLLLIGGGTLVLNNSHDDNTMIQSEMSVSRQTMSDKEIVVTDEVYDPGQSDTPSNTLSANTVSGAKTTIQSATLPTKISKEFAEVSTEQIVQQPVNTPATHEEEKNVVETTPEKGNKDNDVVPTQRHQPEYYAEKDDFNPHPAKKGREVAFAFYAQNTFSSKAGSTEPVLMCGPNLMAYNASTGYNSNGIASAKGDSWLPVSDNRFQERTVFHFPLKYGLSVEFPLGRQWGVQTGLVYQKLQTDLVQTVNTTDVVTEKYYHYVGVPVRLSWHAWQHDRLSLYAVAGGEVDVNVKANMRMEELEGSITRDRLQFSAEAGAGLQYDLLPQIGVFAEPSLRYSFDNGSQADTYFKDKPLNISLQIGIRLTK